MTHININGFLYRLAAVLLCFALAPIVGCANSKANEFEKKIHRMADDDLVTYYHGINARIKDMDYDLKRAESQDQSELDGFVSNMTFFIGGQGYDLIQKRDKVAKEMYRRNLRP